jgi:hypothetical protein
MRQALQKECRVPEDRLIPAYAHNELCGLSWL